MAALARRTQPWGSLLLSDWRYLLDNGKHIKHTLRATTTAPQWRLLVIMINSNCERGRAAPTTQIPDLQLRSTLLGVSRISPVSREAFNGRANPNFQLQHPLCLKSRLKQPLPGSHIEPCTLRGCSYHHNASTSGACRNMSVEQSAETKYPVLIRLPRCMKTFKNEKKKISEGSPDRAGIFVFVCL